MSMSTYVCSEEACKSNAEEHFNFVVATRLRVCSVGLQDALGNSDLQAFVEAGCELKGCMEECSAAELGAITLENTGRAMSGCLWFASQSAVRSVFLTTIHWFGFSWGNHWQSLDRVERTPPAGRARTPGLDRPHLREMDFSRFV